MDSPSRLDLARTNHPLSCSPRIATFNRGDRRVCPAIPLNFVLEYAVSAGLRTSHSLRPTPRSAWRRYGANYRAASGRVSPGLMVDLGRSGIFRNSHPQVHSLGVATGQTRAASCGFGQLVKELQNELSLLRRGTKLLCEALRVSRRVSA